VKVAAVRVATWCSAVGSLYLLGNMLRGASAPRYFSPFIWGSLLLNAAVVGLVSTVYSVSGKESRRAWSLFLIDRASNVALSVANIFIASGIIVEAYGWVSLWGKYTPYVFYIQEEMACAFFSTVFILFITTSTVSRAVVYAAIPYVILQLFFTPYPTPAEAALFRATVSDVFVRIRIVALLGLGFRCIVQKHPISKPLALVMAGYMLVMMVAYLGRAPVPAFSMITTYIFLPVKGVVYCLWIYALFKAVRQAGNDLQGVI